MKRKIILLGTVILLMAGCNPTTSFRITQTAISDGLPTTAVTSDSISPTGTTTPSPMLVSTQIPDSGFKNSCLEIAEEEIPLQDVATGMVIFDKDSLGRLFLLDLQSSNEYEIPTQSEQVTYFGFQASPDRNMLAYVEGIQNGDGQFDKMILWIINSRAEVLQKITFNLPGLYNLRWLDNQSMIFETGQTSKDGTVIFFNPFTHEQHYVSYDFPNFYQIQYNELIPWFVEYSHDMDFVVYLSRSEDGRTGPVLWDVNAHQVIWQRIDAGISAVTPLWSPTRETVAVIDNNRQLYIIDQHGNTRQLPESGIHYIVTSFSWSPDGENIAFWNASPDYEWSNLMIYNVHTNQVIDSCVIAHETSGSSPVWSPDSQAFFVHFGIKKDDGSYSGSTVLVNIGKAIAFRISREPKPLDWMNSIP